MMKQEAIIHIRFLTSAEGGRTSPISGEKYGCPIMVDGAGFDCRFVLNETTCFELGGSYEIPVNFLNPDRRHEAGKSHRQPHPPQSPLATIRSLPPA